MSSEYQTLLAAARAVVEEWEEGDYSGLAISALANLLGDIDAASQCHHVMAPGSTVCACKVIA